MPFCACNDRFNVSDRGENPANQIPFVNLSTGFFCRFRGCAVQKLTYVAPIRCKIHSIFRSNCFFHVLGGPATYAIKDLALEADRAGP